MGGEGAVWEGGEDGPWEGCWGPPAAGGNLPSALPPPGVPACTSRPPPAARPASWGHRLREGQAHAQGVQSAGRIGSWGFWISHPTSSVHGRWGAGRSPCGLGLVAQVWGRRAVSMAWLWWGERECGAWLPSRHFTEGRGCGWGAGVWGGRERAGTWQGGGYGSRGWEWGLFVSVGALARVGDLGLGW